MMGAPPNAASNIRLNVEKLAKVGEANVEFIASRSAEVPLGLNGASGVESPPQPVRVRADQRHRHDRSLGELQHTHGFRLHPQEQLRAARSSDYRSKAVKRGI